MLNFEKLFLPLRLMIVDDELGLNNLKDQFQQAAITIDPRCEVVACTRAEQALEEIQKLKADGKRIHAVAIDYRLLLDDISPIEFLHNYITQNPAGYWFWSSANPDLAYSELLNSKSNNLLHNRMLTGFNKGVGGFSQPLQELVSRLKSDVLKLSLLETNTLILTDREALDVREGSLMRKEGNRKFSVLDELVPNCQEFENAVIIHVPSLPHNTTRFVDAIITRQEQNRITKREQSLLRSAWVARKYFDAIHISTAKGISKDFDPNNWRKYATQFNLNLTWLDVASEKNWHGSILTECEDGGTKLDKELDAVVKAIQAGAVWTEIAPRNFNSQFRPWATVYRSLRAASFFSGVDANSGELKECSESLSQEAASGAINMRVSPDATLFIDLGDSLYNVRTRETIPIVTRGIVSGVAETIPQQTLLNSSIPNSTLSGALVTFERPQKTKKSESGKKKRRTKNQSSAKIKPKMRGSQ